MGNNDLTSSTVKISRKDIEHKSVPIICAWCNAIFRISEWKVDEKETRASHGICPNCKEKAIEQSKLPPDQE